jgi:hypothetical protein
MRRRDDDFSGTFACSATLRIHEIDRLLEGISRELGLSPTHHHRAGERRDFTANLS